MRADRPLVSPLAHHCTATDVKRRRENDHGFPRLSDLARHLVAADRRAAHRLRDHGRFRSRCRNPAALRRPHRWRAPHRHQLGRTGLGGQSGVAHPRRGRHFRRVADGLCRGLLRLLSRHVRRALRPHPASCGLQVPEQTTGAALAGRVGLAALRRRLRTGTDLRRGRRQRAPGCALRIRRYAAHDLPWQFLRPPHAVRAVERARLGRHADDARCDLPRRQGRRTGRRTGANCNGSRCRRAHPAIRHGVASGRQTWRGTGSPERSPTTPPQIRWARLSCARPAHGSPTTGRCSG